MDTLLHKIFSGLVSIGLLFGAGSPVVEAPSLGSTYQTGEIRALFETSLASRISSTDTSFTLVSATDKDGTTLASSTYGFIIDEGTASEELVLADCTATACTNATRGLSVKTGTTTVAALKFEHRRGASVKITDAPALLYVVNVFKGKQNLENILRYNSAQTFNNANDIISRSYADSLSFGAVPAASETASGFVELATGLEQASSTETGSVTTLVLQAKNATSSGDNSTTAALKVVVTDNGGKIDDDFISTTTIQIPPVGSIIAYSSTTAPDGWLLADGSCVSRTTYSRLYALLGTTHDVGCSGAQFGLPNLSGRTIVMASTTQQATSTASGLTNNRATIGYKGGTTTAALISPVELAAHTHTGSSYSGTTDDSGSTVRSNAQGANQGYTTNSTGSGVVFNVLDPYIVLNYIIRY